MITEEREKFLEREYHKIKAEWEQYQVEKGVVDFSTWLETILIREREVRREMMEYIDRCVQGGFIEREFEEELTKFIREKTGQDIWEGVE